MLSKTSENHPVVVLDGGDLFWKGGELREENHAAQVSKAALLAEDMMSHGLDAWVPGEADWTLGTETVLNLIDQHQLPVLAGNLVCGDRSFPGHLKIERGNRLVGVVGVVDTVVEGCTTEDPVEAARSGVAALGEVDVLLGIFQGSAELDGQVLREVPGFDFFFNGHTAQSSVNLREINGAWFLGAGSRGKQLGHLTLSWREDGLGPWSTKGREDALEARLTRFQERAAAAQQSLAELEPGADTTRWERRVEHYERESEKLSLELDELKKQSASNRQFSHELVALDASIADHPETASRVEATLRAIEAAGDTSGGDEVKPLTGGPFAGSEACALCHPQETAQWKTTPMRMP